VLLPPAVNPTAGNKYINISIHKIRVSIMRKYGWEGNEERNENVCSLSIKLKLREKVENEGAVRKRRETENEVRLVKL
jgi:hypothetical protein